MKKEIQSDFRDIQHHRRKRRFIIKSAFLALLLIVATFGIIRFVFYSNFFKFTEVVFEGETNLDKEKVLSFLEGQIENGSFLERSLGPKNFLAWPKSIAGSDLPTFPEIEKLEIEKKYTANALVISALVQEPLGIWCLKKTEDQKCYWFSKSGKIFKESLMPSGNIVKVISDYSQTDLSLGGKILDDYLLENFISIFKVVLKLDVGVSSIKLDKLEDEEITIQTSVGPVIFFSLRHKADNYLPVINSLVKKPGFKKLQYIDLRTENRVFYQ